MAGGSSVALPPPSPRRLQMTPAQLKFLSRFIRGSVFTADPKSFWTDLLHETPASAIKRFESNGLLTTASLSAKLDGEFKATEIKDFLRDRSLPVSGRKAECIERLMAADPVGMERKVASISAYICTPEGKEIAEKFLATEEERRRIAHEQSLNFLQKGNVREALATVAEFERQQVFPRGVGCDWNRSPTSDEINLVNEILAARPKILKGVPDDQWQTIQLAAAMVEIWGERSAKPWLPVTFIGSSNLDPETTVRMVMFAGKTKATLAQFRQSGFTKIQVSGSDDSSCPTCRHMAGRKYPIAKTPEVPCEHCTNEMGCRCMIMPVFET